MNIGQVRVTALWGPDHQVLGRVTVLELYPSVAVALSPGRFSKGYPHLDVNEDGVVAATDGSGTVLAVADGHNGFAAARAALQTVMARAPSLLSHEPGNWEGALRDCFAAAAEAVTAAVSGLEGQRGEGGTGLTVALLRPGGLAVAGLGDCVALVVRGRRVWRVGGNTPFLGPGGRAAGPAMARARLRRGDLVVAATDGLCDFLGRAWKRRLAVLAVGAGPADLAERAVEAAGRGGAGDNIAVAVAAA